MWKAIWGVGGAVVGGAGLYYAPSVWGGATYATGVYNAANDVSEAASGKTLTGNKVTGIIDAGVNARELGLDLVKISKVAKGAPNPLNILGLATFILDKTAFKSDDAGVSSDKKDSKPNDKKSELGGGKSRENRER